ncbi:MAG TPA: acetyl-CoA hydrolase/transferase C-terminal domain-containing protein [Opitutaceae bacterium]|nr:acetyl-CoA hydrolase/transferase C-terminal domain-containing protein [Opitutaceae bacterium]
MTSDSALYRSKLTTADRAVEAITAGMRVFMTGNCSVPQHLLGALVRRAPQFATPVEIDQLFTIGSSDYVAPGLEKHLRVNTLFTGANVRQAVNEGRADYTPCFLSEVAGMFRDGRLPLDAALVHLSPPDEHGFCSLGIEVGLTKTPAESARMILAEVNDRMPRTLGDSFIHVSRLTHAVEVSYDPLELHQGDGSEVERRIGAHCAGLIEDGSTLQMGIGGVPDAVLALLGDRKDLGIHSEMFSDGIIDLVERGVLTGARKTLHPGKITAGFLMGSRRLYDFVDNNPFIELRRTEYINDPFVIAQNDRMVAINSAIEVDLTGQVCADSIGPRIYSGVGGQVDFIYGSSRSRGGKPIIALPSVAVVKDRPLSRIVPMLKPGAGVVTTRNHVHYVVTEHGVADMYGKSLRQRARALIAIADPQFREELEKTAAELHYL